MKNKIIIGLAIVVLIFALLLIAMPFILASIAVIGFVPGTTDVVGNTGGREKVSSDSYWRGEARPFQIIEHECSGNTITLRVQNSEADKRLMESITVGSGTANFETPLRFAGGEMKRDIKVNGVNCGNSGDQYSFDVQIRYTQTNVPAEMTQIGMKPLVGKAS